MALNSSVADYIINQKGMKQGNFFGTVLCMNEKGSYLMKQLEDYGETGDLDERHYFGFQCNEPLFVVSVLPFDDGTGALGVNLADIPVFYLNDLEYAFQYKGLIPELTNYKIGLEHFRKEGSYFVFRGIPQGY